MDVHEVVAFYGQNVYQIELSVAMSLYLGGKTETAAFEQARQFVLGMLKLDVPKY
jgi:hypothetical protein